MEGQNNFDFNKKNRNLIEFLTYCQENQSDKKCKLLVRFFTHFLAWTNLSPEKSDAVTKEFKDAVENKVILKFIFDSQKCTGPEVFDYDSEVEKMYSYFEAHSQDDTKDDKYFRSYINFIENVLEFFTGNSAEEIEARRKMDNDEVVEVEFVWGVTCSLEPFIFNYEFFFLHEYLNINTFFYFSFLFFLSVICSLFYNKYKKRK